MRNWGHRSHLALVALLVRAEVLHPADELQAVLAALALFAAVLFVSHDVPPWNGFQFKRERPKRAFLRLSLGNIRHLATHQNLG